jgi:leader peptidase (prepilin peptidase)/N-methyltransferase
LDLFIACALFVAGLAFGSFLNVCISRIPRDLSIVSPRSHCPHCHAPIPWRDNIPVLSWLALRGRCRGCGAPISLRYPAVELAIAVLYVACFALFGFTWLALKACVFCFLTVGLIFMDAETGLLPREFTYTGILLGLAFAWVAVFDAEGTAFLLRTWGNGPVLDGAKLRVLDAVVGAAFGAGFFYLAWALYYLVRKRQGLGLGDVALIAMVGVFLGLKLTVLVVFLSPVLATIFAMVWLMLRPKSLDTSGDAAVESESRLDSHWLSREVPFGVFLGTCGLIALFFGEKIWSVYLGFFR